MHKAQEALNQQNQESQSSIALPVSILLTYSWFKVTGQKKTLNLFLLVQELLEKLKEAEESHGALQAECDQYRTVLAETVSIVVNLGSVYI